MAEVLRIEPERVLARSHGPNSVPVLEIVLGGTPRGLVVVLDDRGGYQVSETMNRLAEHGYETVASGDDSLHVAALLARAKKRGWSAEQTAVLGIGAAGRIALLTAASYELAAAISLSTGDLVAVPTGPGLDVLVDAVHTPWLGLFGDEDPAVPRAVTDRLRRRLDQDSDVFSQVVRYPGVGVDFFEQSSDGPGYAASYDGWERVLEWLGARVAPRRTVLAAAADRRRQNSVASAGSSAVRSERR